MLVDIGMALGQDRTGQNRVKWSGCLRLYSHHTRINAAMDLDLGLSVFGDPDPVAFVQRQIDCRRRPVNRVINQHPHVPFDIV